MLNLDAEWTKNVYDTTNYNIAYDVIEYDYANDMIIRRFEKKSNVDELAALEAAKDTDPKVRVFSKLPDDARTDEINRNLPQVQDYLRYCEAAGYLPSGRAEVILYGKLT